MTKRYLHIDFKGMAPKAERMPEYLRYFSDCGFDGIVFEFDCRIPWSSLPGAGMPFYTKEEAESFVAEAEKLGMETIPLMQVQGHLEWLLDTETYGSLREAESLTLCPSHPDAIPTLTRWLEEIRRMFPHSRYIHIGADEVWHIGECPVCAAKCREKNGKFNLYLRHASALCKKAVELGFTPLLWGDMFLTAPAENGQGAAYAAAAGDTGFQAPSPADAVNQLPPEAIVVDWQYWYSGPWETTEKLRRSGREIWGASAIQCGWYEHFRQVLFYPEDRLENVLGWNRYDGNVIHTTWGRPGNKWGVYPPWLMTLPLFAAAGNPEAWEKHPWKAGIEKLSRLTRRAMEFELLSLPAEIRQWPARNRLEEESREFLALAVEYQILACGRLDAESEAHSLPVSAKFVGSDKQTNERWLVKRPQQLLRSLDELMPKFTALFEKAGILGGDEFVAEYRAQFDGLKK